VYQLGVKNHVGFFLVLVARTVATIKDEPGGSLHFDELVRPWPVVQTGAIPISSDNLYPLSFDVSSPAAGASEYLQDPCVRLLVDFFQNKGLGALKQEDRQEDWYQDWIDYQAKHGIYASLLSPRRYSSRGHRFDLRRLTRFLEVFAYFGPAHAYSLHVSFLGLFPILMSSNEPLKKEAIARLEGGGLFAFAVSERAHGSDLLANEFTVKPAGPDGLRADGAKYYIGNANAACIISILAKRGDPGAAGSTRRPQLVFFALRPQQAPAFQNVRKIRTLGARPAFVGEFEVKDHPLPESDIISQGRQAWEAIFGTVDFGKFFLGFGSVGICEHAFAEAIAHLRRRILYGKPVTDMPHIRGATASAFARLMAMKLYAYRALDYLQVAGGGDRRYLLFNAVQKAKVSTEGVKVMGLLSECIGARGFEAETYFESALRDVPLIPGLEGSTHINFGLTAQFLSTYFAGSDHEAPIPQSVSLHEADLDENPYWMEARDRNARTVRFAPFLKAYESLRSIPNVRSFVKQVQTFCRFAEGGVSALNPTGDPGLLIALGKCFAAIVYAQLVAENCLAMKVAPSIVSVLFHALIEDLSGEALKLSALFPPGSAQRASLKQVVRVPRTSSADFESIYEFIAARYETEAQRSNNSDYQ
ncbi:MAG: acyl-CoA/acyl-ACP dehydrogenase, partial [Gemmataceae bacterium]|nr:acyl-CoA/acyl-ACP dehydrogenase [Gemmataceae bacterium]